MRNTLLIAVLILGLGSVPAAGSSLHFEGYGFSIDALEAETDNEFVQVLIMHLPTARDFAPNVNVQIQPYDGTLAEYKELSLNQFASLGWEVLDHQLPEDEAYLLLEYEGTMEGMALRWYAKALLRDGRVYLATATAGQAEWDEVAPELKASVDSLELHGE